MSIPAPLRSRTVQPAGGVGPAASLGSVRRAHVGAAVIVATLQAAIYANLSDNGDMLWGARFGEAVWKGHFPRTDSYSWTAHGSPLVANSWAWNVVLYLFDERLGAWGYWLIGLAISLCLAGVVLALARQHAVSPVPVIAAYTVLGLVALIPLPRAQAVSDVVVVVVPWLMSRVIAAPTRPQAGTATAALIGLQILWINVHEGGLLGPALVLICGLALTLRRSPAGRRTLLLRRTLFASVAVAAACLATPYGLRGITHAATVRAICVGLVSEWEPAGFSSPGQVAGLVGAVAGLALSVWVWRSAGRPEYSAAIALLSLCSLYAIRFVPMLAAASIVEVAAWLSRRRARPWVFRAMAVTGVAILAARFATTARSLTEIGPSFSPRLVVAIPHSCRTLNDDVVGDAEILLRPDVQVSLDGRFDMYGRARLLHMVGLANGAPGTAAYLAAHGVNCVLLPTATKIVQQLAHSPAWKIVGHDQLRTLLVRR